eukprot:4724634-Alexandrium_andersonii.AAC.1
MSLRGVGPPLPSGRVGCSSAAKEPTESLSGTLGTRKLPSCKGAKLAHFPEHPQALWSVSGGLQSPP